MNAPLLAVALICTTLMSACATQPRSAADANARVGCDEPRMMAIERAAQRSFAEVHWVNCPPPRPGS